MALKSARHWRFSFSSQKRTGETITTHIYYALGMSNVDVNSGGTDFCRAVPVDRIIASSEMNGNLKRYANDGNNATAWGAFGNTTTPVYWIVDLGTKQTIRWVQLFTKLGNTPHLVMLQCSDIGGSDIANWQQVANIYPVDVANNGRFSYAVQ